MTPSRKIKSTNNNTNIFENSSSSSSSNNWRPIWTNILPILITIFIIIEFAFLGLPKNADLAHFWADTWQHPSSTVDFDFSNHHHHQHVSFLSDTDEVGCEKWLLRQDTLFYSRDFDKDPVFVSGYPKEWNSCSVRCKYGRDPSTKLDARFGHLQEPGVSAVLQSMESSAYYIQNNIANARRHGFDVIMTTSLSSDVPVGYFSWAEYDIMAPVEPKNETAAAFISNCAARNFRLQAIEALEKAGVKLHSYGACRRNLNGQVDKVKTLKRYRFSLAFENSNEEDYVTEKFFQSLVAGTVAIVVGAPNIQDFAPGPGSLLHIKNLSDIDSVAKTMKYLSENPEAFNRSLRWKYEGPSDSFKALIDMAAVHSSCRLCIHLATKIRESEEKNPVFKNRPCKCSRGSKTIYHVYVRERGRFEMESVFLRSSNLTMEALESAVMEKFTDMRHVPIWKTGRPESIRGGDELKIYRIYPLGLTQRQALYTFKFQGENDFRDYIETHPCPKFEVIFV